MKLGIFESYGPCRGIKLFRFGRYTLHLWIIPAGYTIPEHSHPNEDIELCLLKGSNTFLYRRKSSDLPVESAFVSFPRHCGRVFTIPAGYSHGFSVSKSRLIFLNFAKWKTGVKPTSASVDFQLS